MGKRAGCRQRNPFLTTTYFLSVVTTEMKVKWIAPGEEGMEMANAIGVGHCRDFQSLLTAKIAIDISTAIT